MAAGNLRQRAFMDTVYDVAIIGGGILGAGTARELSKYKLNVVVLEQAYDIGEGATKANSGVLAAGFHPRGGSLKGVACVNGNAMYDRLSRDLGVEMRRVGSLYLAFNAAGANMLAEKYQRGRQNGLAAGTLRIISGEEARALEPGLSPRVTSALYAETTGIIAVFPLILRISQSASQNGVEFKFGVQVTDIENHGGHYLVHTDGEDIRARYVVNTAGEAAMTVERRVRPADLIIRPRRGQFIVFDKQGANGLRHVLYQAQENDEKGCLLAPTIEGNILAGPTSENVRAYKNTETTAAGLAHIVKVARKIMPDLDLDGIITAFAGARANIKNMLKEEKDFIVWQSAPRMVSALGIKNPGLTAAPYLTQIILQLLQAEGLKLAPNPTYRASLNLPAKFVDLDSAAQQKLFKAEPRYGNIVCRCETVTEGDILRVLAEPLPPHSLNGLKKRLRTGMGRCQGGFCTPRIIEILSREWRVRPETILKSANGSNLVAGPVK